MAAKKRLSDSVVVNLLQQMLDSQNHTRESLNSRLDDLVAAQRATNDRLDLTNDRLGRLQKAVVGFGRVTSLEDRVRRIEERIGILPET